MGINGLLKEIEAAKPVHIKDLKGKSIVIDGHCFLHRTVLSCCKKVLIDDDVTGVIKYLENMLADILKATKSYVILVFDGGCLPSKLHTDSQRRKSRESHLKEAKRLLSEGNKSQAFEHLLKSFHITSAQLNRIADALLQTFRSNFFIVKSPFEADAQVSYLSKAGFADVVMTIDSDIVLHGPASIFLKYDPKTGFGELLERSAFQTKTFADYSHLQMQQACILTGCDYMPSLFGVGFKTALSVYERSGRNFVKAAEVLHHELKKPLPEGCERFADYALGITRALLTFNLIAVYDPISMAAEEVGDVLDGGVLKHLQPNFWGSPMTSAQYIEKLKISPAQHQNLAALRSFFSTKRGMKFEEALVSSTSTVAGSQFDLLSTIGVDDVNQLTQ